MAEEEQPKNEVDDKPTYDELLDYCGELTYFVDTSWSALLMQADSIGRDLFDLNATFDEFLDRCGQIPPELHPILGVIKGDIRSMKESIGQSMGMVDALEEERFGKCEERVFDSDDESGIDLVYIPGVGVDYRKRNEEKKDDLKEKHHESEE
jgi:hypothetical protein